MKFQEICEGYDKKHKCLTPGTIYHIKFKDNKIKISLDLPKSVKDVEIKNYEDLEADLHYAVEKLLAKHYFR
jgi:hypothetical protein